MEDTGNPKYTKDPSMLSCALPGLLTYGTVRTHECSLSSKICGHSFQQQKANIMAQSLTSYTVISIDWSFVFPLS